MSAVNRLNVTGPSTKADSILRGGDGNRWNEDDRDTEDDPISR